MAKSKRYKIAKKLTIDVLIKYDYFRKKEKKSNNIFLHSYKFVRHSPNRSEKQYGESIRNRILKGIAMDAEKGRYYDKNEISDFIDLKISEGILYDYDETGEWGLSKGLSRQQQINDLREAIVDFRRLDPTNLSTDNVYTQMVREKIKIIEGR